MSQDCLTADDLREMLAALDSNVHESESRSIARRLLCAWINILPDGATDPIGLEVHDISLQGIGMLHTESMEPNTRFTILAGNKKSAATITCSVIYCVPTDDGRFRIGARFESDPSKLINTDPLFNALKD